MYYQPRHSFRALHVIGAAVLVSAGLSTGTGTARAADAAGEELAVEEITVTARKRAESVQDVPESISVFSGAQLDKANVVTMRDLVDLTPNMIIRETFRSNESFLTMRGIASAQGALPPVAIVVDGVQVGSNDFLNQDLYDIERIEVLRGPQGALYGQGAIAGAINIVTKAPANELEAFMKSSYANADTFRTAAGLSGALVDDRLYARLTGYYKTTDGLIENRFGEEISFHEEYSVRGRLMYQGERLSASLRTSHTTGDGSCCTQDIIRRDENGIAIDIDDVTNPGADSNIIGTDETRFTDTSLKLEYDFNGMTLTSITGYAEVRQDVLGDLDFTAAPIQVQDVGFYVDVFNQELRLTSPDDARLRWIAGGFYQGRKETLDVNVLGDVPTPPRPLLFGFVQEKNSDLWAAFGQLSFDLTSDMELSAALRYDRDDQDSFNTSLANPFAEATFDQLQPKVQISYDWSDNVMTYATWSKGFRTGGFSQTQKFENEVTTNYEVGMKASLVDGSITMNTALFHIDYANQQLSFVVLDPDDAANTLRGVLNIPETAIDGLELEIAARATDYLNLTLGVGIVNSEIVAIDNSSPFASPAALGKASPLAPPFTFNAGVDYTYPLVGDTSLVVVTHYRRRGGYYFDLNNTLRTGTMDFIDGKVAIESDRWSVGLWGSNLADTRHATNVSISGADLRVPNQPRSFGIEASLRF
jgi:iron complex outermembrane receptor protein